MFLKTSRLVKRRALAKEFCEEGAVSVNGNRARAGREVQVGDRLELTLRTRRLGVDVLEIPARAVSAARAKELYRVVADERIEDEDEPMEWSPA